MIPFLFSLVLATQDPKPPPAGAPAVDEAQVDAAIKKGIAYLRTAPSPGAHAGIKDSDELILWTYVHAGVRESDPDFQKYFRKMVDGPLEKTYKVALQAMILEEVDRVKYQERIAQCAVFLVDNQCVNGQWGYGAPTPFTADVKIPETKSVATPAPAAAAGAPRDFGQPAEKQKPRVVQKIPVKKSKDGPPAGDNSNTQYAALGLRACHDAGIVIPDAVLVLAVKWWRDSQQGDVDKDGKAVATGGEKAEGWNYKDKAAQPDKPPYQAMTAGGTSSLILYDYILGRRWKESPSVKEGMAWLARHWTLSRNYYYLYGLERTGILFGTDKFGDHFWYAEGAKFLLKEQNPDGSWGRRTKPEEKDHATQDTCFAILFLKKATRPLVASEDRK